MRVNFLSPLMALRDASAKLLRVSGERVITFLKSVISKLSRNFSLSSRARTRDLELYSGEIRDPGSGAGMTSQGARVLRENAFENLVPLVLRRHEVPSRRIGAGKGLIQSFLFSVLFTSSLLATAPRITLENFEKDLQEMAKTSKSIVMKDGSFVDRVAEKRRHKQSIDLDLAGLQGEIDGLKKEIVQLDAQSQALEEQLTQETQHLEQRIVQVEHVVAQLEHEQNFLRPTSTLDT
jgi:hypothetical protein